MPSEVLTSLPSSFVSGDALRVTLADSNYPSTLWTLKVWFQTATATTEFTATAGPSTSFSLYITSAQSAALASGKYRVGLVFTEIAVPNDRATGETEYDVTVLANPAVARPKSQARKILEAMEAAMLLLSSGSNASVSFNGQSFTKRNLKEFQDALDRQRAIVAGEDALAGGTGSLKRILHPV